MKIIDCCGLTCPIPVINTKKYFESIQSGSAKVIVDNEISKKNLEKFASSNGFDYSIESENDKFILNMNKHGIIKKESGNNEFSILIGTNKLGEGDNSLGETLMKSYLYALSESNNLPRKIMFLNSGVKLVSKNSNVLESLKVLEGKGVELLSCGVCLEFYGLKDSMGIGAVTNMYSIVEEMNLVSKLIKL